MRNNKWRHKYRKSDSAFEESLIQGPFAPLLSSVPAKARFQPKPPIGYSVEHAYTPDFEVWVSPRHYILVEAKGRFMDSQEAAKYKWIRESLEKRRKDDMENHTEIELVFLFQKPGLPMPNVKKRKDGTKQTHAEWAEKNGFRWFTEETIKTILK